MNLKKSYRIIDSRRGEVRKPSRIRDNGWRPHSGRQVYQVGRDLHFEKEFEDRDEAIAYARRLHEDTRDRTYVRHGYESDWGLDGQERVWNSDTDYVGDSARVNDMAIRDMAVRGKGAIDRNRESSFNEFYGNHPELNKLLDADSQLRKDAIDFFDTADYLGESGYGDWVDKTLDGLLSEYPFGYNLGYRYLIFHLKNKHKDGTTRVFYFPDRGVINIENNSYLEIGGNSDKKANARFMEKYNDLEFDGSINHRGIDEVVADVTGSFFATEEEEFGSSEIEDSARVSDDAYDLSLNDLREPYTGASEGKVYYWVFVNDKPYDRVFDKDAAIWKAQQYEGTGYRVSVKEFVSNGRGADPDQIGVVWSNEDSIINDYI